MRYGKLVNNNIKFAPNPLKIDGSDIFTNNPSIYAKYGYKPIIYNNIPISPGYVAIQQWVETTTEIVQTWNLVSNEIDSTIDII